LARLGNPRTFPFPRSFATDDRLRFSFSGLKTAVLYTLKGQDGLATPSASIGDGLRADLAASFQEAVVDILAIKADQALRTTGLRRLMIGGGVAANGRFRERLAEMVRHRGAELLIPPPELCTDNAALGGIAFAKLAAGDLAPMDIDVTPGLVRQGR